MIGVKYLRTSKCDAKLTAAIAPATTPHHSHEILRRSQNASSGVAQSVKKATAKSNHHCTTYGCECEKNAAQSLRTAKNPNSHTNIHSTNRKTQWRLSL